LIYGEFIAGVIRLYTSVCQTEPDEMLLLDLSRAADIYGAVLRTPREVQLTLNTLAFRYSGLRDYVWYQLCASCSSSGQSTRIFMTGPSIISPKGQWWSPATVQSARRSWLRWSATLACTFRCFERQKRNPRHH
jgi:hypothetical protein